MAVVGFNITFNLKEWSNISSVPNSVEFTFIICSIISFLIRLFVNILFDSGNGNRRILTFARQIAILELYNHLILTEIFDGISDKIFRETSW